MNAIYKYITLLTLLLMVGCTSAPQQDDNGSQSEGEFCATVEVTRTSSDQSDVESDTLLDSSVLKIYNSTGGMVRYYTAVSGTLIDYLAEGRYYATYRVGVANAASFDSELSYYGQSGVVSIVSQHTTRFEIEATVQNTILTINLDDTSLGSHFDEYYLVAYAANSVEEVDDEETPQLTYTSSADGYFIIPDGVENLVWEFVGDGKTVTSGVINGAQKGYQYTLSFKYTDYLNISGFSVNFAEIEYSDDVFDFKVQPIINSIDFDADEVQDFLAQQSFNLAVTSISPLSSINVTVDGNLYSATFTSDATTSTDKIVYDTTTEVLTLRESLFTTLTSGTYRDVEVVAVAENGATDEESIQVGISGFAGVSDEDFWAASAKLSWYTTSKIESMQMRYRNKGNEEWIGTYEATSTNGHLWSATNEIEWSAAITNDSLNTVYEFLDGYKPSQEYEYQVIIDGVESDVIDVSSSSATIEIPYADFSDSSLSCYTQSNGNAEFWASGNNSYTSSLCTYDSSNGCAYLATTSYLGTVAAGNMFTGTFAMGSGFSGTASFGQVFEWNVRPKSLSFRYKVTVGSTTDKGRVFVAIVDWSSRHGVTSGTGDPSGTWNPEADKSVDEGQIIGYGNIYFESSTSSFDEIEIPIYYYDKTAVPTKRYQIVISTTASYRGDYTEGSTSSKLWVDDLKFNY